MSDTDGVMQRGAALWTPLDTAALVVVTLIAAVVRVEHLTTPASLVFDEDYYARDACTFVEASKALCHAAGEVTTMHPPLAKWLIAGGIELLGFDPLGWRIAPALAGTLTVPLLYILARRVVGSSLAAAVASGALAIDFLHVVMSRVAMLDVFVTLFGTASALFLVLDHDSVAKRTLANSHYLWRPWRGAAGIAVGGAIASKWSGIFVLASVLVLSALWGASRRGKAEHATRRAWRQEWTSTAVFFVIVPLAVYAASYYRRIDATFLTVPGSSGWWPRAFAGQQLDMLRFHLDLHGDHVYASPAWSWLLLKRPVGFYFEASDDGYREILALGNPTTWWLGAGCVGYAMVSVARSRDPRSPALVIVVLATVSYLPWVLLGAGRDVEFLYYLLPTVPFLCLALGFVAQQLAQRLAVGMAIVVAWAVISVAAFVIYQPLLTARPLPYAAWKHRMLFEHCANDDELLVPRIRGGRTEPRLGAGKPPSGWCWI